MKNLICDISWISDEEFCVDQVHTDHEKGEEREPKHGVPNLAGTESWVTFFISEIKDRKPQHWQEDGLHGASPKDQPNRRGEAGVKGNRKST